MIRADWKKIITKAWSIRLIGLAFVLTGVEVFLAIYGPPLWLPLGVFAALSSLTTAGAFAARLYAQKDFEDGD